MSKQQYVWDIRPCEEADSQQLGFISWNAFENSDVNAYIRPRHLRPQGWTEQQKTDNAAKRILGSLRNPKTIAMKAVSADQPDVIAGNALWAYSDVDEATNVDTVEELPDEATRDVSVDIVASRRFKDSLQANAKTVMGGRRHLNLIGIATHPNHLRKGVASALIAWGVKEAEKLNIPVLIESVPHARPLYLSNGFTENGKWTIDYEEKDAHGNQMGQKKTITLYMMIRETK